MLKFLENRDPPRYKRGQDFMRFESNSHLPNNKQFNSPLHQDVLIHHDKPQYYVTKKLPPVSIYNPLVQLTDQVDRPEYIIKQKEIYHPRYMDEYQRKGFKKKQGIFESFQHLLNKNQILIEGVHSDKKPLSFPAIRQQYQKIYKSLNLEKQLSSRSQDESKVDKSNQDSIDKRIFILLIIDHLQTVLKRITIIMYYLSKKHKHNKSTILDNGQEQLIKIYGYQIIYINDDLHLQKYQQFIQFFEFNQQYQNKVNQGLRIRVFKQVQKK